VKLLCVASRVPYPVRDGGNARSYGCLRELARRHEVSYLCRADEPRPEAERRLAELCHRVEVMVDPFTTGLGGRLRAVAAGHPFGIITAADAFFQRVRRAMDEERFDLVYLVGVDTALLALPALERGPVVWDVCDCTSRYYRRQAGAEARPWRRLWYRLQARRYRALERRVFGRELTVVVGSASEAAAYRDGGAPWRCRVEIVSAGVDPAPLAAPAPGPPRLVFTGALGYPPNADAALYFCREIFPRVRRHHPDARAQIVGAGASPQLQAACRAVDGVELLGFVPDVSDVLGQATIFVCPMRQGTGVRVKLLEAMACGLPIVASPLAVEGIAEAEDGRHLRIAATTDAFARCLLELLADAGARRQLGDRARGLTARYAWDRLGDDLDRHCRAAAARRSRVSVR
jgi:glycosyltransferase involved in cell wall biosynthesis